MASSQIIPLVKQFQAAISSAKLDKRKEAVGAIKSCLQSAEFQPKFLRVLFTSVRWAVGHYVDPPSRRVLRDVVAEVRAQYPSGEALLSFLEALKPYAQRPGTADGLKVLRWACHLAVTDGTGAHLSDTVTFLSELVDSLAAVKKAQVTRYTYRILARFWDESKTIVRFAEIVRDRPPEPILIPIMSQIIHYCKDKEVDIGSCQKAYVELYCTGVLSSRTQPSENSVVGSLHIVRSMTHEQFANSVMPAIKRALLRNPEIILECVQAFFANVSIDMSRYVEDLTSLFLAMLRSKDGASRTAAVATMKSLAAQCSDGEAVLKAVKLLAGPLTGTQIAVNAERQGLLGGIDGLAHHAVTGSSALESLTSSFIGLFIPVLKQEVHEGTLCLAVDVLRSWCRKITTEVPKTLSDWFTTALGLKSATSAVRFNYLLCMNAAYESSNTLEGIKPHMASLLKTVEKASGAPGQTPVVLEALAAACLLVRLEGAHLVTSQQIASFWEVVTDEKKQLFTNEKFLNGCGPEGLKLIVTLTKFLMSDYQDKTSDTLVEQYMQGVVYALLHRAYNVRQIAQKCVKRLVGGLRGITIAMTLVSIYEDTLNRLIFSQGTEDQEGAQVCPYSAKAAVESLPSLLALKYKEDREASALAVQSIKLAHNKHIVAHTPGGEPWEVIIQRVTRSRTPHDFVVDQSVNILLELTNEQTLNSVVSETAVSSDGATVTEALVGAVATAVRLAPPTVFPMVVQVVKRMLDLAAEMYLVTAEEYAIFQWADGDLYDTSVLEKSKDASEDKNVRRENKLYSYKEQMMEMELRKEIEAKKRAQGKLDPPKLTKKQEEAKAAQIKKEKVTRERVAELDRTARKAAVLLRGVLSAPVSAVREHTATLLDIVLPLLRYPVTAPHACPLLATLGKIAFDGTPYSYLADLFAYATVLQLDSPCKLPGGQEALKDFLTSSAADQSGDQKAQLLRAALLRLDVLTAGKGAARGPATQQRERADNLWGVQAQRKAPPRKALAAAVFAFCFPLVEAALAPSSGLSREDLLTAVDITHAHTSGGHSSAGGLGRAAADAEPMSQLPATRMFRALLQVLRTGQEVVATTAGKALVSLCTSLGGGDGQGCASRDEIDLLLHSLLAPAEGVRVVGLKGLNEMPLALTLDMTSSGQRSLHLTQRILVAQQDAMEPVVQLADSLWTKIDLTIQEQLPLALVPDCSHEEVNVRKAASVAMYKALSDWPGQLPNVLDALQDKYKDDLVRPPPVTDSFGRVIQEGPPDRWGPRVGVALTLSQLAPLLTPRDIHALARFYVPEALNDRHSEVAAAMRTAGVALVEHHGKAHVDTLLPILEDCLAQTPSEAGYDSVKQSVVVLMGTLAKHLDPTDARVLPILSRLIASLHTPSQQVQEAVAHCLPHLVGSVKKDLGAMVSKLLTLLLTSTNYGERRGAAYGLAGLVKGAGVVSVKQLGVMARLEEAVQNKKDPHGREGALFAYEMLFVMMGRLFEPYVVHVLPHLLTCFSDASQHVRTAADDTAKAVMAHLSGHGVKLVLPKLLSALDDDQWRTKIGSVELLGAMAYCAPKQLSACLPQIVPPLCNVLADSHSKVQKAGSQALQQIGDVIKNPEIQVLVPVLLGALQDPSKKTTPALRCLLETRLVHFIDAPSLALIMPVVTRAIEDRSSETRKMAAQIIGNMYSLTDQKDLAPYLRNVLPGLKKSLVDPAPEVRAVSSRALGAMVRGAGEGVFDEVVPWLRLALVSEGSTVDRSGAAQGLSEVIAALGDDKLERHVEEVIATAGRSDIQPHVRDGYIMMYIYLPVAFGDRFAQYVGPIIPSILQALADEAEFVRDTALRAGRQIIDRYADTAIALFLPEIEKGLFSASWRIRLSSVTLLGDLLYSLSGVSGKMSTQTEHEDDNLGTESSQLAIGEALGPDRRNRVLAGLYMGRSDVSYHVRQASLHIWKIIVSNTPKTLREILATLFELLLGCLACDNQEKRQVAATTLGDVVKKLGEAVLPEILPILEKGLDPGQPSDQRQGVCIGLTEIMKSTTKDQVMSYADSLVSTVRSALMDDSVEVREAAADTFSALHDNVGARAMEEILPFLLDSLVREGTVESERALDAVTHIMALKSAFVLPFLVPVLTNQEAPNTRALSYLAEVAGSSMDKHLKRIIPSIINSLADRMRKPGEEKARDEELSYGSKVVLAIKTDAGVRIMNEELLRWARTDDPHVQASCAALLHVFCNQKKVDYKEFHTSLFRAIFALMCVDHPLVSEYSWHCLDASAKTLCLTDGLHASLSLVRTALRYGISDHLRKHSGTIALKDIGDLPGLSLPKKGAAPLVPLFKEGLVNGPPDTKELASASLAEVIKRTSAEALRVSVVHITGPLVRILGDRYSPSVKLAVLETLIVLLNKCGQMLRPFLPQLQSTLMRALSDPARSLRLQASSALGQVMAFHAKVDPLFSQLLTEVEAGEEPAFRDTFLQALRECLLTAGPKISEVTGRDLWTSLQTMMGDPESSTRSTAGACAGALASCYTKDDSLLTAIRAYILESHSKDWVLTHSSAVALMVALKVAPARICGQDAGQSDVGSHTAALVKCIVKCIGSDRVPVSMSGYRCAGYLLRHQVLSSPASVDTDLIQAVAKGMKSDSNEKKQLVTLVVGLVCGEEGGADVHAPPSLLKAWAPMLVNGTRERNTGVKSHSEASLVTMLRLKEQDNLLQACVDLLESAMGEALQEIASKATKRNAAMVGAFSEKDFDDSMLR